MNQSRYPIDPIRVDLLRNYFSEAYNAYQNVCRDFGMLERLKPEDWRNLYPIFCLDLSAQNEDLKKKNCDVTINIEKKATKSVIAYAVVYLKIPITKLRY